MTLIDIQRDVSLGGKGTPSSRKGGAPGGGPAPGTAGPPFRSAQAAREAAQEAAPMLAPGTVHNMRRDPGTGRVLLDGVPVCSGCGRPSETPFCAGARGHVCRVKRATEMQWIRERVLPLGPIRAMVPQLHGVPAGKDRPWPS